MDNLQRNIINKITFEMIVQSLTLKCIIQTVYACYGNGLWESWKGKLNSF